jgi:hypothetical protein
MRSRRVRGDFGHQLLGRVCGCLEATIRHTDVGTFEILSHRRFTTFALNGNSNEGLFTNHFGLEHWPRSCLLIQPSKFAFVA